MATEKDGDVIVVTWEDLKLFDYFFNIDLIQFVLLDPGVQAATLILTHQPPVSGLVQPDSVLAHQVKLNFWQSFFWKNGTR